MCQWRRYPAGWYVLLIQSVNPANRQSGVVLNDNVPGLVTLGSRTASQQAGFYTLKNGKTHTRFRLINMSAYSHFVVTFDGHPVTVIEVDGVLIEQSKETYGFQIAPGQRISVLVKHKPVGDIGHLHPYRIVAALGMLPASRNPKKKKTKSSTDLTDPRFAPANPDLGAKCGYSNQKTIFTWGCFMYEDREGGTSQQRCQGGPSPEWPEYSWLKFYSANDRLQDRPRTKGRLKLPWKDVTHTTLAYPWDFNEREFKPLLVGDAADSAKKRKAKLTDIKPENVFWMELIDKDKWKPENQKDPDRKGFGSINNEL